MADLSTWANSVASRYIDVDQWEGNQCWDLSQHWLTTCNGGTLWTQPSRFPGLAAGSWEVATQSTANTADLLRHVTAHPGTEPGLPGDIIIFAYGSPSYPISHTAVLLEDRGTILRTLSQNSSPGRPDLPGYSDKSSGPTIYQDLTRAGVLGFLRPRATITGQGTGFEPIQEDDMELTPQNIADIADGVLRRATPGGHMLLDVVDSFSAVMDGVIRQTVEGVLNTPVRDIRTGGTTTLAVQASWAGQDRATITDSITASVGSIPGVDPDAVAKAVKEAIAGLAFVDVPAITAEVKTSIADALGGAK